MPYIPVFSERFIRDTKKLDKGEREKLDNIVEKIIENPDAGKSLRYKFKGCQSIRRGVFRVIYTLEGDRITFIAFGHRGKVYR
ncbi:MAG: type II toxin-antitoxin system RelE/ParE family toxin [Candidatus Aerophobetes bacterium]